MFRPISVRTTPATPARAVRRFAAGPVTRGVAVALTVLALGACSSDDDDDDMADVDVENPMDPDGMDPDGTDPDVTDPDPMDPDGMDPDGMDPDGMDPDGMDPDGMGGMNGSPEGSFAIVMNDGSSPGSVIFYSPDLATMAKTLSTGANQGIAFDSDGTLYQNADADSFTGLRAFPNATGRADMDGFGSDGSNDAEIGGAPGKGLTFASFGDGVLLSCDVTDAAADLKIFATDGAATDAPVQTLDLPASCWDSFYSEDDDRLYLALTDGRLGIYDEFSDEYADAPVGDDNDRALDRIVTPVGDDGTKLSTNFHGVFIEDDAVLVSDVGSADSPTDGLLFTFTDDGSLDGDVPSTGIGGPATMLGNPVDVVLLDGTAIVAEKSNDVILAFEGVADLTGDVAPSYSMPFTKPESVELAPAPSGDGEED